MSATTLHMSATTVELGRLLPTEETVTAVVNHFKSVALFLVAPFIGLAYAMALPFVGLAMLALVAYRAAAKSPAVHLALTRAGKIALIAIAPLLGLVYAVLLPFIGIAMIARTAYAAARA